MSPEQLAHQGRPFNDIQRLDDFCPLNDTFPSINQTDNKKEILVALYKIFAFFNASLGNITKDQTIYNPSITELLQSLNNTSNKVRGLLFNLTCLLCSAEYNVSHVDVTYGKSSNWKEKMKNKREGCQVLRWYKEVISEAASILNKQLV